MADDDLFDYFFLTQEQRADKRLEQQIDQSTAMMMSIQRSGQREAANLRQQLGQVTGSLDTRITSLQRMFSAYVELNDIKETLQTTFTDSSDQRRRANGVLNRLATGHDVERLESDKRYWLPDAVNAVAAIVAGTTDPESEARARFLDPRADEFVVLAATSLGHGAAVADRLPDVLVTDGSFSASQQLLWRAALAGDFGHVLPSLRPAIAPTLSTDGWADWIFERAKAANTPALAWLEVLTRPISSPDEAILPQAASYIEARKATLLPTPARSRRAEPAIPNPTPTPSSESAGRQALTRMMQDMVAEGLPEERDLLVRLRIARATLEDPKAEIESDPGLGARADVTDEVRTALVIEGLPAVSRKELLSWIGPVLRPAIEVVTPARHHTQLQVSVRGTQVPVTAQGYEQAALAVFEKDRLLRQAEQRKVVLGWGIAGAVVVLSAVILFLTGNSGLGWFAAILAVPLLLVAIRQWWGARADAREVEGQENRVRGQLNEAVKRAGVEDSALAIARGEETAVADLVGQRLA